jgi:hypothetical protein
MKEAQVGAAEGVLGRSDVQCASLKANMGHLEAAAAAAGLSSLAAASLLEALVPVNAQLRRFGLDTSSRAIL